MGHILPSGIAEHQKGLAYVSSTLDASQCKHMTEISWQLL